MIRGLRFFLLFLALALAGLVSLRWGGWLRVREVKVFPTRYAPVEKLTGGILGANILRLDLKPLHREVLADPRVLAVDARVHFFRGAVVIDVRERSPVVPVGLNSGEKVWVDRDGVILEPAAEARVVGVRAEGGRVGAEVVETAMAWERLPLLLRARLPLLDLSGDEAVAPGPPRVLFGAICQVPEKLSILIALWRAGFLEGYNLVDLRGDDMVILKRR